MQLFADYDFAQWRSRPGIAAHPRFPQSLAFAAAPDCEDVWMPSGLVSDLPGFLQTIVGIASEDRALWLYRNFAGSWYEAPDAPIGNHIIDRVISAIGVPREFEGAVGFNGTERRDLYLMISTFFADLT